MLDNVRLLIAVVQCDVVLSTAGSGSDSCTNSATVPCSTGTDIACDMRSVGCHLKGTSIL